MNPYFDQVGYWVGQHRFDSPLEAFIYAAHHDPHTFPQFSIYQSSYSQIDWTLDPPESFQELMKKRAIELRNKYDYLVFAFSGGTDSITIYRIFEQLNIHIDEIIVGYEDDNDRGFGPGIIDWLIANHYDATTKITTNHRTNAGHAIIERLLTTDDHRYFQHVYYGGPTHYLIDQLNEKYQGKNWGIVMGYEKPHIVHDQTGWYVTFIDKVFRHIIGQPALELFFLTPTLPELHVKQCHLLYNYAKNILGITQSWNSSAYSNLSQKTYYETALACGRHLDVIFGSSSLQKKYLTELDRVDFSGHKLWDLLYKKRASYSSDATTKEYLSRMSILDRSSKFLDTYHGIVTQKHYIEKYK